MIAFKAGDVIVCEGMSGFQIAKVLDWQADKGYFEVERAYHLMIPDARELPPDLQQKIKDNPNAMPIGFAPVAPFYEGPVRVQISACASMGRPKANAHALYIKNTTGIVLPGQIDRGCPTAGY